MRAILRGLPPFPPSSRSGPRSGDGGGTEGGAGGRRSQHVPRLSLPSSVVRARQRAGACPRRRSIGIGEVDARSRSRPASGARAGALHLRSDLERKALFNADELEHLPGEAYGEEATAQVYAVMLHKARTALRAGHSVIADAVHAHSSERDAMAALVHATGARLHSFWLEAPPKVLLARVAQRKNDASDATPQVVERQMTYDLGQLEWTRLDASGPLEETLRTAMSHLHASIDPQ